MRYFKISIGLFILVCYYPIIAYSQTAAADLEQRLAQIKTLDADFKQVIVDENDQVIQESTGHVVISRPGKFRWQVKTPMEQLIVTNGERLWIYDPDLEQVQIKSADSVEQTPALLLSGHENALLQQYQVSYSKQGDQMHYQLIPDEDDSNFSRITLSFQGAALTGMELIDKLGQKTLIHFDHIRVNQAVKAGQFNFKPYTLK